MHTTGIITEYNPFHNGHIYHINKTRELTHCTHLVCIMSGSFTQRGEAAIADKWTRARWAVDNGVDLVIELPVIFATASAEAFAQGAVRLLHGLGFVDSLCFGSETADHAFFESISKLDTIAAFTEHFKKLISLGRSYPTAFAEAATAIYPEYASCLKLPNNILGIEYVKALNHYSPHTAYQPLLRQGSNYHDTAVSAEISSATAIRTLLSSNNTATAASQLKQTVPPAVFTSLKQTIGTAQPSLEALAVHLFALLRTAVPNSLAEIEGFSEGLENKFINAAMTTTTLPNLLSTVKSRRYPYSRLQRNLVHLLLNITKQTLLEARQSGPLYARILAFNAKGCELLKKAKATASLPIITKTTVHLNSEQRFYPKTPLQKMLALDTMATDFHDLITHNPIGHDFTISPYYRE